MNRSSDSDRVIGGTRVSMVIVGTVLALVALPLFASTDSAYATTPAQVSSTNAEIQSAFVSVYAAEKSGGNTSSLVTQLNEAIQLVQKAEAENATEPTHATADLQNATRIAQDVAAAAPGVAQAGASARRTSEVTSTVAASAIIMVAVLTYFLGGRVYRRAWLRLYKDFVVRPANG